MMATDDLRLDLLGSPSAAGLARTLISQRLCKWGYARIIDDVLLVASELITNAAKATPNERIQFRMGRDGRGVFVSVWDGGSGRPVVRPVVPLTVEALDAAGETFDGGGGWGLPLVQALSTSCGVQPGERGGKWVWATFAVQP